MIDSNKTVATRLITESKGQSEKDADRELTKYIKNISVMNKRTAREYYLRLSSFQDFVINRYKSETVNKTSLQNIIANMQQSSEDAYEVLSDYVNYLQTR